MRLAVQHSLESGDPYSAEYRIRRPDGSLRFIHSQGEVIRDAAGRVIGMQGIHQDITARKQTEDTLRELPRRIIEAQENERRRVARELHDGVNQILSTVRFRLQAIESRLEEDDRELRRDATKAKALLERALNEVRRISENLRPSELDELGLVAALQGACEEFQERTGVATELRCARLPKKLPAELNLTLYRTVQESLNNIEKHAEARRVTVRLGREDGLLILAITDDGAGIEPRSEQSRRSKNGGFGLVSLRERAAFAGGTLDIQTAPQQGTTITVRLPIPATKES